jgi:hypothetical protein
MAKRRRPVPARMADSVTFTIENPSANQSVTASGGRIPVTIDDATSTDNFTVRILAFSSAAGVGGVLGSGSFPAHVSNNIRTVSVPVGSIAMPVTGNNRQVQVEDEGTGDVIGHAFLVSAGSSGSGPTIQLKLCRPGQLVPVALALKLDTRVSKGTCAKCAELNRATILVYAAEAQPAGTWLSRPIAIAGKNAPPAYWVLQRRNTTTWMLALKQGETLLATFTASTKPKDCSLPLKLQRQGAGSRMCKDWPKTVTISAAP